MHSPHLKETINVDLRTLFVACGTDGGELVIKGKAFTYVNPAWVLQ
jgi:hypothetical protein